MQNQARFDRLPEADLISEQNSWSEPCCDLGRDVELMGNEVDASADETSDGRLASSVLVPQCVRAKVEVKRGVHLTHEQPLLRLVEGDRVGEIGLAEVAVRALVVQESVPFLDGRDRDGATVPVFNGVAWVEAHATERSVVECVLPRLAARPEEERDRQAVGLLHEPEAQFGLAIADPGLALLERRLLLRQGRSLAPRGTIGGMSSPEVVDHRPAVLLLHSSGMSSRQWARLSDALSPTHRVIAPDLLGSGENPPWPDNQSFDLSEDVDALERIVAGLAKPVHIVGHSYGGLLAVTLARRIPGRILSVAAYDPVAFGVLHGAGDAEGLADLERAGRNPLFTDDVRGGSDAWFEVFVDYWNGPGAWRGMTQTGRGSFLRVGRKVFLEVMSLIHDRTPASAYSIVTAPALFLGGARSPAAARRVIALLASAFPQGRALTIEGAGHMGPLTHGTTVNDAIVAHIRAAS